MDDPQSQRWPNRSHRERCRTVGLAATIFARDRQKLLDVCQQYRERTEVEWLTSEWTPLCAALMYLRKRGYKVLTERRIGTSGRPVWLWGVSSVVTREPWGKVLLVAPGNYPVFLPGVQVAQALAAGNHVLLKPAVGCEAISRTMVEGFVEAGVPSEAITLLDSAPAAAKHVIDQGVDLVVLTGSSNTGRAVLQQCAARLTPTIMELSGCDALVVGPGADLEQVAKCLRFAVTLNSGATCIGPRRIFVAAKLKAEFVQALKKYPPQACHELYPAARAAALERIRKAFAAGAEDVWGSDVSAVTAAFSGSSSFPSLLLDHLPPDTELAVTDTFAPVACLFEFVDIDQLLTSLHRCPYRLAASIYAHPAWAKKLAMQLDVGTVTINDSIFPTADPRTPFPACGESGFGVTRGAEGLLQMTRPKVISIHRGTFYPHLRPSHTGDARLLSAMMGLTYGTAAEKWRSFKQLISKG